MEWQKQYTPECGQKWIDEFGNVYTVHRVLDGKVAAYTHGGNWVSPNGVVDGEMAYIIDDMTTKEFCGLFTRWN